MDNKISRVGAIEAFTRSLQNPDSSNYGLTILYMVFKTIEANPNITINRLKTVLQTQFYITATSIEGALSSLTNETLFGCISTFHRSNSPLETTHLHVKPNPYWSKDFSTWINNVVSTNPELLVFIPPKYVNKKKV